MDKNCGMEDKWSVEPMRFTGTLSQDRDRIDVGFTVGVDAGGEAVITIDRIPFDTSSKFLSLNDGTHGTRFTEFNLVGATTDGAAFECENVIFTSMGNQFDGENLTICPVAHYSCAHLTMAANSSTGPVLMWHLKGFQCFGPLQTSCSIGDVLMEGGARDMDGVNQMSGYIRVSAEAAPPDVNEWRESAEKLCEHLNHVMSFASDVNLAYPLTQFFYENQVKITLYSRGVQGKSNLPPFQWLDLEGIFECAVRWHFGRPYDVRNLYFATQWFTMHGAYREANLISSMTVLENLIDSNISETDGQILEPKTFEKLRRKLSAVVKDAAKEWTEDPARQQALVHELNNRFSDLKRRSLVDKLKLLAKRWGVKLDDIPEANIQEAKSARDQVVHRGHYQPKPGTTRDLHDHVLTVRELVVRFILTALQFEGRYFSYVDGQQSRVFERNPANLDCPAGEAL